MRAKAYKPPKGTSPPVPTLYAETYGHKSPDPDDAEKQRRHDIKILMSTGTSLRAIAELVGITPQQLKLQYQTELHRGTEYVYGLISKRLVTAALEGDRQSQLAWLRQFGGWQEVTRKELTGVNGGPISVRNLDIAALTAVVESLTTRDTAGRGKGRADQTVIDVEADLDPASGAADEGIE